MPRFHLRSCSTVARVCALGGGSEGSAAFEQTVEVVFDGSLGAKDGSRWFASAMGSWLLPHRLVAEEKRAVLETELSWRSPERGLFQLYVTGLAGNELGYLRSQSGSQLGFGIRWAP